MLSHEGRWLARGMTWGADSTTCRTCPLDRAEWLLHLDSSTPVASAEASLQEGREGNGCVANHQR